MKLLAVATLGILFAGCSGCVTQVTLSDVAAERGPGGDVVVHFKADVDILRAAQFKSAALRVPAQQVSQPLAAIPDCPDGQVWLQSGKIVERGRAVEGKEGRFSYSCSFPSKGSEFCRTRDFKIEYRFDLSRPGEYELEFSASGGTCFGPGAFETNSVIMRYVVP
jgi:hypothetical protein